MQTLSAKRRAAALKRWERQGRHHDDSYSLEAIKLRREMRRTTKGLWDLIAQADNEALIESRWWGEHREIGVSARRTDLVGGFYGSVSASTAGPTPACDCGLAQLCAAAKAFGLILSKPLPNRPRPTSSSCRSRHGIGVNAVERF